MVSARTLKASLQLLTEITSKTHNVEIAPQANTVWRKHLQAENPLWQHVEVRVFRIKRQGGMAHVMAIIDRRLPDLGLVGFFGATTVESGVEVLDMACSWLKQRGLKDAYGPINGTITRDYRFNLSDDYKIPGEPVNPTWYVDVFRAAGFDTFNHYVSGIARYAQLYVRLVTSRKPEAGHEHIEMRRFDPRRRAQNLKIYHELMNAIFTKQSIYCPVITLEERAYNVGGFDAGYCYFLYDGKKAIGFIVAHPHKGNLILKTIALLPEYRGKKLSDIMVRRVHEQAKRDRLKASIYSTIRVGNAVYRARRSGVRIYREYVTLHKHFS